MAVEPEPPLTLKQRLLADTPIFWKVIGFVGLLLGVLVAGIKENFPGFSQAWLGILAGISGGMVTLSPFAVRDASALAKPDATVQDYLNLAQDLKNQYSEVKASVEASVANIKSSELPAKAEDIPIVKDVPVIVDEGVPVDSAAEPAIIDQGIDSPAPPLRNKMVQQ